ncbi:MAG: AAA family ATPase [Megasphaera sp.]|nr:AAA family ATPase [Megasphaera sp.]MCI1248631.1 AAA family ATPase [Megasphaera sp.]
MEESYFDGIIGHQMLKRKLTRLIKNDRVPHAMIFAGPAGLGKTRMALATASAVVGRPLFAHLEGQTDMPVVTEGEDAYYISPMGAMLKVDQFRQLQEQLMLQGRAGSSRVAVIDHVETMNTEFANRMLKILEEPPAGVVFILITDQASLLLPTIISRCVIFSFEPVGDDEMSAGLIRYHGGTKQDYEQAVSWGGGIVSTVLAYISGNAMETTKYAFDFLHIIATHPCPYAKWLSVSIRLTDQETKDILRWAELILRDLVVLRSGAGMNLTRIKQYKKQMEALLPYWTDEAVFTGLSVLAEGREALLRHVNTRLVWDYVCLQFIKAKGGI